MKSWTKISKKRLSEGICNQISKRDKAKDDEIESIVIELKKSWDYVYNEYNEKGAYFFPLTSKYNEARRNICLMLAREEPIDEIVLYIEGAQ